MENNPFSVEFVIRGIESWKFMEYTFADQTFRCIFAYIIEQCLVNCPLTSKLIKLSKIHAYLIIRLFD